MSRKGFSIVQVMVAGAILAGLAMGAASYFSNLQKNMAGLEGQMKKELIRAAILGQTLGESSHCKCWFQGAADFPVAGIDEVTGVNPQAVGRYIFATPGDCATATMPSPILHRTNPTDYMLLEKVSLLNVRELGGIYTGNLAIDVTHTKVSLGAKTRRLQFPVIVNVTPAGGGMVRFSGCGMKDSGNGGQLDTSPLSSTGPLPSTSISISSGSSRTFSMPGACTFECGPKQTVTVNGSSPDHIAAFGLFSSNGPKDTIFFTYDMSDNINGQYGAYQDGDGQDREYGSDVLIKLTNQQFKLEMCSCSSESASLNFRSKYFVNP